VNEAERRLRHLLLAAGFEEGLRGESLRLDRAIGTTTPDVLYRTVEHDADEGVCVYLDGLSQASARQPGDRPNTTVGIRDWLRNNGYELIEIAANDLYDEGAMTRHFRKLAGYLGKSELKERLRADTRWYDALRRHLPLLPPHRPSASYFVLSNLPLPNATSPACRSSRSKPQQVH
jgi:hypothetical protein